jgi:hypothetical protein
MRKRRSKPSGVSLSERSSLAPVTRNPNLVTSRVHAVMARNPVSAGTAVNVVTANPNPLSVVPTPMSGIPVIVRAWGSRNDFDSRRWHRANVNVNLRGCRCGHRAGEHSQTKECCEENAGKFLQPGSSVAYECTRHRPHQCNGSPMSRSARLMRFSNLKLILPIFGRLPG